MPVLPVRGAKVKRGSRPHTRTAVVLTEIDFRGPGVISWPEKQRVRETNARVNPESDEIFPVCPPEGRKHRHPARFPAAMVGGTGGTDDEHAALDAHVRGGPESRRISTSHPGVEVPAAGIEAVAIEILSEDLTPARHIPTRDRDSTAYAPRGVGWHQGGRRWP